ncbi:MAG: nitrilase [Lentisphaerae bacterium]|nr:nitrilase [Lentisphaerota bacterium]MCP4102424.1 nitrilase [Lentisphaerota bacterium]
MMKIMKNALGVLVLLFSLTTFAQLKITIPDKPPAVIDYEKQLVTRTNLYSKPPAFGKGIRLAVFQNRDKVNSQKAITYNLAQFKMAVKEAKAYGAQMVSFPELYMVGDSLEPDMVKKWAASQDGPIIKEVGEVAKKYNMGIIFPYPEKAQYKGKLRYFDSVAVIGPQGKLLENWRKVMLFSTSDRQNFDAGSGPYRIVKVNGFPFGVLICYEAEFFEAQRILALKGAKLIVVPNATFTYSLLPDGKSANYPNVGNILMPAYAFANNTFVAFSNHTGYEPLDESVQIYQGNTLVAGPDGQIILQAKPKQTTLLIVDIVPEAFPPNHPGNTNYLKDRRPRLFHYITKDKVDFDGGFSYPKFHLKGE